jgi:hypothetical protein
MVQSITEYSKSCTTFKASSHLPSSLALPHHNIHTIIITPPIAGAMNARDDKQRQFAYRAAVADSVAKVGKDLGSVIGTDSTLLCYTQSTLRVSCTLPAFHILCIHTLHYTLHPLLSLTFFHPIIK